MKIQQHLLKVNPTDCQSIMYLIPKDQLMEQSTMFENVFATLGQSDVTATSLHLTDEMDIGGSWVTGLVPIAQFAEKGEMN